jgi:hypothetical protein
MKYLRRYNEELEPSTYRKAADKLINKGRYHRKRGEDMQEYASLVDWRRLRDRCKHAGILTLRLETSVKPANSQATPDYVGEFHPVVELGLDMFSDELHARDLDSVNTPPENPVKGDSYLVGREPTGAWSEKAGYMAEWDRNEWVFTSPHFVIPLHWFVSAVPTTEEGYEQAHAAAKKRVEWHRARGPYDKDYGFPLAFFHFDIIFSGGSYEFGTPKFYSRDDLQVDAHLEDRSGSGRIRSEILRQLDEKCDESCSIYIGGEKHKFSNPLEAFEGILQYYGLSSDHGLESKAVYDYVKKIPGNFFTC